MRRSKRPRKTNPKYANDGWNKETLRVLRTDSQSSGSSPSDQYEEEDSGDEANGTSSEAANLASRDSSLQPSNPPFSEADDGMTLSSDNDTAFSKPPRAPRQQHLNSTKLETRSRGLPKVDRPKDYSLLFSDQVEDLADAISARDTWLNGRDITLPSQSTLDDMIRPVESSADSIPTKDDNVFQQILSGQLTELVDTETEKQVHIFNENSQPHGIVLGPDSRQHKYHLDPNCAVDFGLAWTRDPVSPRYESAHLAPEYRYREGWLINLGEKVQTLAWAPSHTDGSQFLAVSVRATPTQRHVVPQDFNHSPAFHPSPPYSALIQIWRFDTLNLPQSSLRTLNMSAHPRVAANIVADWGDIRQVAWRPLDSLPQPELSKDKIKGCFQGVLAVLSSDGHVRTLAVSIPLEQEARPVNLLAKRTFHDFFLPSNAIFTALAFASATDLVLGTSSGEIHIYDLSKPSTTSYFSHQVHATYIVSLSCASSTDYSLVPYVASLSATGILTLTDLRSPYSDTVSNYRSSFPMPGSLMYNHFARGFITLSDTASSHNATDSTSTINSFSLRSFHSSTRVAKLPEDTGAATILAGSFWHPCILAGTSRGDLYATNHLWKTLPQTRGDSRLTTTSQRLATARGTPVYLQMVCGYEWRPVAHAIGDQGQVSMMTHPAASAEIDHTTSDPSYKLYHGIPTRQGVSRFSEGFLPTKMDLGHTPASRKRSSTAKTEAAAAGGPGVTLFEEEQALTALDWNPNQTCAGLAAVGWASGILRVQDLTHDYDGSLQGE